MAHCVQTAVSYKQLCPQLGPSLLLHETSTCNNMHAEYIEWANSNYKSDKHGKLSLV